MLVMMVLRIKDGLKIPPLKNCATLTGASLMNLGGFSAFVVGVEDAFFGYGVDGVDEVDEVGYECVVLGEGWVCDCDLDVGRGGKVGFLSVHGGRQSVCNDSRNQRPGRTHSEHMMVPAGGGLSGRRSC